MDRGVWQGHRVRHNWGTEHDQADLKYHFLPYIPRFFAIFDQKFLSVDILWPSQAMQETGHKS